ncbi:MAG TPA: diacylglycerol kinase family protein [Candidatus Acidoferrales bacterium]|nr:diacylglycerol kinase family protein [Candidatus Acidoferrales bacterium]
MPSCDIRNAAIIYNPTSGRNRTRRRHALEEAACILRDAGIDAGLLPTTCAGSATELARDAATRGCEMLVVCGGDGTINEVVNGIAGTQVPLAVLPAGTANILAKELRIPWNIPAAARLIANGKRVRIALGLAVWPPSGNNAPQQGPALPTERYFLCVAGTGPDGAIVHGINVERKLRVGILAYWLEGLRQFFIYPFPRFRIASPEKQLDASLIVVGRTKHFGGPFRITTRASLFDNQFEIVAYEGRSRLLLLACLPAVWLGALHNMPGIHAWKTAQASCAASGDSQIFSQIDGEAASAVPVEFRIVPDALTLVVPANSQG